MKAVAQDRYGPADVLELREVAQPSIGKDQLLVRVHAAGVDPGVWICMTGRPYGSQHLRGLAAKEGARDLEELGRLIGSGAVTPVVGRTYSLADTPDAIRYLAEGHSVGKTIITI